MKIFNKKSDEEKVEEEIISMVNEGNEQGFIEDSEAQFITNIFEFTDKESRDVMTARLNVMAIDKNAELDEVMEIMLENNYSRYPVIDGDLDNVVGIIYFKDFVKEYLKDKKKKLADIMVEATFVHPTYNIAKLFRRMQTAKIHMVIVVDEYGQTEGIVTMEDILEEIEFPDEDFQTMNGFLLYELGRLPYADEEIEIVYQNYKFTSLSVSNNMIGEVKITKVEKTQQ